MIAETMPAVSETCPHCKGFESRWHDRYGRKRVCPRCNGARKVLTEFGQKLKTLSDTPLLTYRDEDGDVVAVDLIGADRGE